MEKSIRIEPHSRLFSWADGGQQANCAKIAGGDAAFFHLAHGGQGVDGQSGELGPPTAASIDQTPQNARVRRGHLGSDAAEGIEHGRTPVEGVVTGNPSVEKIPGSIVSVEQAGGNQHRSVFVEQTGGGVISTVRVENRLGAAVELCALDRFARVQVVHLPGQPLNITSFVSVTPAVRPGAAWYCQ